MRYRFIVIVVMALLFNLYYVGSMPASSDSILLNSDVVISMDFKDVSLKDLLKVFSIQSGLNFIASEMIQDRKITLYLDKVPVKEAMEQLFKANNLTYDYDDVSNIIIIKDWGKPQIETITKIYALEHASVSTSSIKEELQNYITERSGIRGTTGGGAGGGAGSAASGKWKSEEEAGITSAIKKILSEHGKLVEDPRTNSLIITDIPSRFPIIEDMIKHLDVPIPMVMLEVEMLDVSKNVVDKLGFEFGTNPLTLILPGGFIRRGAEFYIGAKADRNKEGGITLGHTYAHVLNFLRTQTDTKYLARPRLLTLNNETAEIKITTQESVGITTTTEATSGTSSSEPERAETGVSLRVTPQINLGTSEITMFIYPQLSEAAAGNTLTSNDKSFVFRDPEIRSTKTMVKVKDGETIIVGGLIRNEFTQVAKKVPILGDIPLLGLLFRHKGGTSDKNRQRELLVFITPHIIKDSPMELAKTKLTERNILPEREQEPSESATERKKSINSLLNNFER